MQQNKKVLSVFSLVMINVIAVDSLRTLPMSAKLGYSLITYYLLAAVTFFVPIALVAAELATAYPNRGGLYVWVREAFGRRAGFMTIWLQWIYNVVWYPTILAFIAATFSYLFAPALATNKLYLMSMTCGLFWLFTLLNCFGMRLSSVVSTIGAIGGTLIPMGGIILLGALWYFSGKPIITDAGGVLPDLTNIGNLALFSSILFGLMGMEMSAVHAEEVRNPQRDYPRAILYSLLIIFATLMLSSLAIVLVVPNKNLSVVSGLIDAFDLFFAHYHLSYMTSITAVLIIMGGLCGMSAWIIGPTKGLLVAAQDGSLPPIFKRVNKHGAPVSILIAQGIIVTLLSTVYVWFDTINAAYWLLSDLCAQMALLVYLFMFSAAIRLRYTSPEKRGSYKVPGGNACMWIISGIGSVCCLLAIMIGFIPPTQIPVGNIFLFESFLVGGLILFVALPWLFSKKHR